MRRVARICFFLAVPLSLALFSACSSADPPFEVKTAAERRETMIGGFGHYVLSHPKADKVLVHREVYRTDPADSAEAQSAEAQPVERPVDFYYPPGCRFNKPLPTVLVVGGNINWDASVTLAELLAANGFLTVVPETLDLVKQDTLGPLAELITLIRGDAEKLFIDPDRLAVWTEGHPSALALPVVMDRTQPFHSALQCAVFASPVITFGRNNFKYDPADISPQVPIFISRGEEDSIYEVKISVKNFMKAAEKAGCDITYLEVEGGNHNWMTDHDTEASRKAIKAEIEFLEQHL